MPIFEYKCVDCGRITEFLEAFGARRSRRCAHCGGRKLHKRFSTFALGIKQGESKQCDTCSDDTCPHAGH
jgi:putative FmdB family regulatory protein